MDNIYKHIEEYNSYKKCKILIVFVHVIADMLTDNKLNWTYKHNSKQLKTSRSCI